MTMKYFSGFCGLVELHWEGFWCPISLAEGTHSPTVSWWLAQPGNSKMASLVVLIHVNSPHYWHGFFTAWRLPKSFFLASGWHEEEGNKNCQSSSGLDSGVPTCHSHHIVTQSQSRFKEKAKRLYFSMGRSSEYVQGTNMLLVTIFWDFLSLFIWLLSLK